MGWLAKEVPNSKACEDFTVQELQQMQITLFMLRDPELNDVYHNTQDSRRMKADINAMAKEWEELNAESAKDPELARMHRDGHCHEAVMWYVHHLPRAAKAAIKDKAALPLLSMMRHDLAMQKPHAMQLQRAYEEKVSCASCHSAVYPSIITV